MMMTSRSWILVLALLGLASRSAANHDRVCCNLNEYDDDCRALEDPEVFGDECVDGDDDDIFPDIGIANRMDRRMCRREDMNYCPLPKLTKECCTECAGKVRCKRIKIRDNPLDPISDEDACDEYSNWVCKTLTCEGTCEADGSTVEVEVTRFVRNSISDEAFCDATHRGVSREVGRACPTIPMTFECCTDETCLDRSTCKVMTYPARQHKTHKGFCWDALKPDEEQRGQFMCPAAAASGDPHFRLWNGNWYDYHGQCDLVMVKDPTFADDDGLIIQVRTSVRLDMSFIETAAIKFGNDILEVSGYGRYFLNGVDDADLHAAMKGNSKFRVVHDMLNKKEHKFDILLNGEKAISVKTHKDIVSVTIDARLPKSVGLLGEYSTGVMLARNGTRMTEENAFGQEWQVRAEEAQIFQSLREPQYPQQCVLPDPAKVAESRRLNENAISKEAALEACSGFDYHTQQRCVFDVMRSGDLEMAAAGAF